jgi:hypothetical protein
MELSDVDVESSGLASGGFRVYGTEFWGDPKANALMEVRASGPFTRLGEDIYLYSIITPIRVLL